MADFDPSAVVGGGRWKWGLAAAVLVIAAAVALLLSGGESQPADPSGDLSTIAGESGPSKVAPSLAPAADVVDAHVHTDGEMVTFEVTAASAIPEVLERSSLEFRFDISENGSDTWIVTATINVAVTAGAVSQAGDYTASTIDNSLPGSVAVDGDALEIVLDASKIEDFPLEFEWSLTTSLLAARDDPDSARAEDRYPDTGTVTND